MQDDPFKYKYIIEVRNDSGYLDHILRQRKSDLYPFLFSRYEFTLDALMNWANWYNSTIGRGKLLDSVGVFKLLKDLGITCRPQT